MKHLIIILGVLATGCSMMPKENPGEQQLIVDARIQPLGRNEVIDAVKQCETTGLRAIPLYAKRKINGYSVETVVEVTCGPKYQF